MTVRRRRHRHASSGVTLVEFAMVAPVAFLILLGTIILAVVVTTQVSLTNATRDAVRAAAACGSDTTTPAAVSPPYSVKSSTVTALPNGNLCYYDRVRGYVTGLMPNVSASAFTFQLVDADGNTVAGAFSGVHPELLSGTCVPAFPDANTSYAYPPYNATTNPSGPHYPYAVSLKVTYSQDLFVPLVGYVLGDGGTNTRTITAQATATCEQ